MEEDDRLSSRKPSPTARQYSRGGGPSIRWGRIHLDLDQDDGEGGLLGGNKRGKRKAQGAIGMDARERALWRWINVDDLDGFLQECYLYYVGRGIWAIGLSRLLNLL